MYLELLVLTWLLCIEIWTTGYHIITISCLSVASLLSTILFYEVCLFHSPVRIKLFTLIESDYMRLSW